MPTSHYAFRFLSFEQQCAVVWDEGQFLMTRYEEEDAINLYQMAGGFFVEVYFDQFKMNVYRAQAFNSVDYIHNHYTTYVQLPPLD